MSYNPHLRDNFVIQVPHDQQDELLHEIRKTITRTKIGTRFCGDSVSNSPTILASLRSLGWVVRPQVSQSGTSYIIESSSVQIRRISVIRILKLLTDFVKPVKEGEDPYFDIKQFSETERVFFRKDKIEIKKFENLLVLTDDTQEIKGAAYYFIKSLVDRGLSKSEIESLLEQAIVEVVLEE